MKKKTKHKTIATTELEYTTAFAAVVETMVDNKKFCRRIKEIADLLLRAHQVFPVRTGGRCDAGPFSISEIFRNGKDWSEITPSQAARAFGVSTRSIRVIARRFNVTFKAGRPGRPKKTGNK